MAENEVKLPLDTEAQEDQADDLRNMNITGRDCEMLKRRAKGATTTPRDSEVYFMNHGRRGDCHIFVYEKFYDQSIRRRDSANEDTNLCKKAFKALGFEVFVHKNLTGRKLEAELSKASERDHTTSDAFVVVFMSHGGVFEDKATEYVCVYDSTFTDDSTLFPTSNLWEPFIGERCPTLAGKPKLFFIQACRGSEKDYGVSLDVMTDALNETEVNAAESYVIPSTADILVMWASNSGMFAFKSRKSGINGSVFIHFLAQELQNETSDDLGSILLNVTRRVALDYESYCPGTEKNKNKQVPQILSTLLRKVVFPR